MAFVKKTIKIKKYSDVIEECLAGEAITPGMLVHVTSADNTGLETVKKHSVSEGTVLPMFALEDELQGKEINDAYGNGDKVQVWIPGRGDIVNAILEDGEDVAAGDFLVSAGNGKLKQSRSSSAALDEYPEIIVGTAVHSLDMSDSSKADPLDRIQVRIK